MIGLLLLFISLILAGIGLYRAERALQARRDTAVDAAEILLEDLESTYSGDGAAALVEPHRAGLQSDAVATPASGDGAAAATAGQRGNDQAPRSGAADAVRSILIVDLDAKARTRLREMLSGPYALTEAENAQRATELLERRLPSLVIVATNVRDRHGHPFWERIRRSEATASVPVVVLDAVAAGEELQDRYRAHPLRPAGVLRKPILIEEVRETVMQVLEGRGALSGASEGWLPAIDRSDEDTRFVRRAQEEVERQIANPAFGVRELSEELGLSARQLQRRLRDTTGQSPNAFIRSIRLQHAVRLLERGSDPVSQIAYAVGFNSLSYFAKCFREHFGHNPSNFAGKRSGVPFQ